MTTISSSTAAPIRNPKSKIQNYARLDHLPLVVFEIKIEMGEDVILDVSRDVAQPIEFGKVVAGMSAFGDKARAGFNHRALQLSIGQRALYVQRKGFGGLAHHLASAIGGSEMSPARISAT